MKNKKSKNYIFENDTLRYESFNDEFTFKQFKEFNLKSKELKLTSKIANLINGELVNETENQAALHPKYRSDQRPKYSNDFEETAAFLNKHMNDTNFNEVNIITLGIGGSYEGPKLLLECFNRPMLIKSPKIKKTNHYFITGSDCSEFKYKTKNLNPENTFFVVSSKSFTTDETINSLKEAFEWSNDRNKFIAITANPEEAQKYGIEKIIKFDKEIGGRYSIWSPISQFHLCDKDFISFAKGGHQADVDIQQNEEYFEFVKYLSFSDIHQSNTGKNIRAILSYIWNLRSLPNYFQQLEMESLGKPSNPESEFKSTGQVVFGGYGPTAQHSYFQLLHQGTHKICTDIITSREDEKSLAYAQAVTQSNLLSSGAKHLKEEEKINGNVPSNLFILNKLDPHSLGYLIASWEYRTYITATILKINPFDQYGVQAGKNFTREFLKDNS